MVDDLSGFSMHELFRLEAESQTGVLSAGVLAIEELDRSPTTIEGMMRAAHSLKGAARIVGLEPAVEVAHALEDVFVAAGRGDLRVRPEHADVLLAAVDFLGSIANADDALTAQTAWSDRATAIVARLAALPAGGGPLPSPATAASPPPTAAQAAEAPRAVDTSSPTADSDEPAPGRVAEPADRVVRVSADSLTRLVGLAGEALVETRQMRPFVDALMQVRSAQVELCDALAALDERLE
ncbi:MAG: hybrid sensor histidine kinase/response regulator, partial [Planctomycetes bacterium]|nr:hybrid sensor histidine kinase/response regulator [Planctomycetota bacterium]